MGPVTTHDLGLALTSGSSCDQPVGSSLPDDHLIQKFTVITGFVQFVCSSYHFDFKSTEYTSLYLKENVVKSFKL